jgi:hypothetical protein
METLKGMAQLMNSCRCTNQTAIWFMLNIHKLYYFTCKAVTDHTKVWALWWPIGPSAFFNGNMASLLLPSLEAGAVRGLEPPSAQRSHARFASRPHASAGPSALDCMLREK